MKVVFLDQSGQLGGAELMLADLASGMQNAQILLFEDGPFRRHLEDRNIPVEVVSRTDRNGIIFRKDSGLFHLLFACGPLIPLFFRLLKCCRHADILYANTPKAWVLAALCSIALRKPLICHLHDIISPRHFSRLNRLLLVQCANAVCSAVISNSKASADAFINSGGKSSLITVIPNGFDVQRFAKTSSGLYPRNYDIRVNHQIPHDKNVVAVVGRLAPWKGQHVAIQALSFMPEVHGLIIGDALFTEQDRQYAKSLPTLARSLGISNRIHFLGFHEDIIDLLNQIDLLIHCSTAPEPFGRVIVEAMLCGTPVIVADEGGAAEIVTHEVAGLHHRSGDVTDLANQISALLGDPDLASTFASAAREIAVRRYSLSCVNEQTLQVIQACIP